MPSLKAIRTRIASVKSTQKITRAMKMVAGARLSRAQQRIVALRPYAVKTGDVLRSVAETIERPPEGFGDSEPAGSPQSVRPRLAKRTTKRPEKTVLLIVLTSDRGLCGAFNANVNKAAEREWRARTEAGLTVAFATAGRKGREYLQRRGASIAHDFARIYDGLDLSKGTLVTEWLVPRYWGREFDSIDLIYTEFKSAISQKVVIERLLPLPEPTAPDPTAVVAQAKEFIFEPSPEALLERLVPMYLQISIYRALLESQASEFGARMTAMDSATRNAKEMIERLTLSYNRARQAAITKELMEIIGGAEALKE